jgi:hypothetical protein
MFAFFNLGAQEFLILLVIALLYGVPILLVLGVVLYLAPNGAEDLFCYQ